jgi:predicted CoA-binding protein
MVLNRWFAAGAAIAVAFEVPDIWWQAQHQWATVAMTHALNQENGGLPNVSTTVGWVTDTDAIAERILTTYGTITVVGASAAPAKAAHFVPAHMQQHGWRIIPVNPHAEVILGEHAYRALRDVPGQVGLVNVFRPPEQAPDIARQAVAAGATALWLQLGIASPEARVIAEEAGLLYVEDRCLIIEQRRLRLHAP